MYRVDACEGGFWVLLISGRSVDGNLRVRVSVKVPVSGKRSRK